MEKDKLTVFFDGLKTSLIKAITVVKVEKPEDMSQEDWDKLSDEEKQKLGKQKKKEEPEEEYGKPKGVKKSEVDVAAITKSITDITNALDLSKVEGEDASPLAKELSELRKDNASFSTIFENVLKRLENIEKALITKKSLDGQEGGEEKDKSKFDSVVKSALKGRVVTLR